MGRWLEAEGGVELGFPNHIADAVANLKEELDDVGGEGMGVEGEGTNFGNVRAKGAVNTAALDAEDYAQVDGDPFRLDTGVAVGAPLVTLVGVTHDLEEF